MQLQVSNSVSRFLPDLLTNVFSFLEHELLLLDVDDKVISLQFLNISNLLILFKEVLEFHFNDTEFFHDSGTESLFPGFFIFVEFFEKDLVKKLDFLVS